MAVTCRSNDILWGAHGANVVHFSILQEYMAARLGLNMGRLDQYSFNYHLYEGVLKVPIKDLIEDLEYTDHYLTTVSTTPIFTTEHMHAWERELPKFLDMLADERGEGYNGYGDYDHPFLQEVALPMLLSWDVHKAGYAQEAVDTTYMIRKGDWQVACTEWMARRLAAKREKLA
jgi:hypothetical protein